MKRRARVQDRQLMKVAAVVLAVAVAATLLPVAAMPAPIEENPLFEKVADPVSGVVSYALKYGAPDDNRQSLYFTAKSMTDDGRYLVFWYTKGNEAKGIEGERLTMVADLETGKVLPIAPLVEMGTPFVDTKENYLVYGSPEADGFWKVPFADPTHPVKLCGRPKALEAFGRPVHYYSHLTLTPDRKKAFLDAALESADGILFQPTDGALTPEDDSTRKRYVQGLLALETGDFDFWGETPFCCNHGQLNPVRGDLAMAAWERCWEGEGKKFQKESGVYPRMWFVEKGKRTLVALPRRKIATHELWDDDGTGHIWCGSGIWHRDLATGEIDCWLDGKVSHAAHATASPDKKYVVFDHQADPKAWWRGCGWSVTFLNRETGQMVDVFSVRPPLVPKDRPSQLHPDPHPHFVMNARYVVSTACNADGHMDLYVTPVAQLVAMTSAGGSDANDPEAALAARLPDVFTRAAKGAGAATFRGYGSLSEGYGANPVVIDLFEHMMMQPVGTEMTEEELFSWLKDWARRRYGFADARIDEAWQLLANGIYNLPHDQRAPKNPMTLMPSWEMKSAVVRIDPTEQAKSVRYWEAADVRRAAELFSEVKRDIEAKNPSVCTGSTFAAFVYDWANVVRQAIADEAASLQPELAKNPDAFKRFLQCFDEMEAVLACVPEFRLDSWERQARAKAGARGARAFRRMITTWRDPAAKSRKINDYARREYAGLMGGYYKKRWEALAACTDEAGRLDKPRFTDAIRRLERDFWENGAAKPLPWKLRTVNEAAWSLKGWQREAYSLGNGFFGASVFGGVATEHIQFTEPTFCTRQTDRHGKLRGNLTDALDVVLDFGHGAARGYLRELDLDDAIAATSYESGGVRYTRECFASFPARVFAMRLTASKPGALSFAVRAEIPFADEPPPFDRTGTVEARGDELAVSEVSGAYGVRLAARVKVVADGTVATEGGAVRVTGAREATLYISLATDYELCPGMFAKIGRKRPFRRPFGPDPSGAVAQRVADAAALGWNALKARHVADFRSVAGRSSIELDFNPADARLTTAELRQKGAESAYLVILYWKFGKYLLASSSRPGTLPASLQGVWSGPVAKTSWGSGYWHNINEQMNYWPAFVCNMADCFAAYAAFNRAFRPATRTAAADYVRRVNPGAAEEPFSPDAWTVGTAVYPYEIQAEPSGHSGPGTGGLTTALYVDWYDFTQDRRILEDECWPVVHGMADVLTRAVVETNGLWLAAVSASPEQVVRGKGYYQTVGCAFDQQMIELNNAALLRYAQLLGRADDPVVRRAAAQAGKYAGVAVGASGQIKEFREENEYGEIGQKDHRHISHLTGLYPGALVNRSTAEWLAAAKRTLDLRGDETTGWARAHRACCRARTGEGDKALEIVGGLIRDKSRDNLWNLCGGVNMVDGNLGATAAIAEMLIQSHERDENGEFRIDLLPALPKAWAKRGSFKGLRARGGRVVDCEWRDGTVVTSSVRRISKENGQ